MIPKMREWQTIGKPGWFGEDRAKKIGFYTNEYGAGNWRIRHQLGPRVLDFDQAVALYELSYRLHFLNPLTRYIWMDLIRRASEVWIELPSDVECGTDYYRQNAPAVHYEDMAIRRILAEHGLSFQGDHPIRVRGDSDDVVGVALSSIHVPFVFPDFIERGTGETRWFNRHRGSLEEFWHENKILQVRQVIGKRKVTPSEATLQDLLEGYYCVDISQDWAFVLRENIRAHPDFSPTRLKVFLMENGLACDEVHLKEFFV